MERSSCPAAPASRRSHGLARRQLALVASSLGLLGLLQVPVLSFRASPRIMRAAPLVPSRSLQRCRVGRGLCMQREDTEVRPEPRMPFAAAPLTPMPMEKPATATGGKPLKRKPGECPFSVRERDERSCPRPPVPSLLHGLLEAVSSRGDL
jgi:hypothetical protein